MLRQPASGLCQGGAASPVRAFLATRPFASLAGEAVAAAKTKLNEVLGGAPGAEARAPVAGEGQGTAGAAGGAPEEPQLPQLVPEEGFEGGLEPELEARAATEPQVPHWTHWGDSEKKPGEPDVPVMAPEEDYADNWKGV